MNVLTSTDKIVSHLTHTEIAAIKVISIAIEENNSDVIVLSSVADKYKLTRSVCSGVIRILAIAGIIETRSLGMKGQYIKVINPEAFNHIRKVCA